LLKILKGVGALAPTLRMGKVWASAPEELVCFGSFVRQIGTADSLFEQSRSKKIVIPNPRAFRGVRDLLLLFGEGNRQRAEKIRPIPAGTRT
jgi:hypothetical protein